MILSLSLSSLNVSNYHIADSIMQKFSILTQCKNRKFLYFLLDDMKPVYVNSCMIQENGLSCPFPSTQCCNCFHNTLIWQDGVLYDHLVDTLEPLYLRAQNFKMTVKILVYKFNSDSSRKELYRNQIDISEDFVFDSRNFYSVFSFLYPGAYLEFTLLLNY